MSDRQDLGLSFCFCRRKWPFHLGIKSWTVFWPFLKERPRRWALSSRMVLEVTWTWRLFVLWPAVREHLESCAFASPVKVWTSATECGPSRQPWWVEGRRTVTVIALEFTDAERPDSLFYRIICEPWRGFRWAASSSPVSNLRDRKCFTAAF